VHEAGTGWAHPGCGQSVRMVAPFVIVQTFFSRAGIIRLEWYFGVLVSQVNFNHFSDEEK
jgi:hypothetical protein